MHTVSEHLLGDLDDRMLKSTTSLSGGIGSTYRDLCGALTAGVMVSGGLHGLSHLIEEDARCQKLAGLSGTDSPRIQAPPAAMNCGPRNAALMGRNPARCWQNVPRSSCRL